MQISKEEQEALSHAYGNEHLRKAYELLNTDKEAVRAAHWNGLSQLARRIVIAAGNMDKGRADDALAQFTAEERGKANISMVRLMKELEIAIKCMQGGKMPSAPAVH